MASRPTPPACPWQALSPGFTPGFLLPSAWRIPSANRTEHPAIADKACSRCFLGSRVRGNDGSRVVFSNVIPANAGTQ
ncbi:hypothetical protein PCLA_16f0010 [Pseudomonas citronellolis]|nr:hypothetical protein PCLA_16f0010 [Pseudomonas citronellolis]